MGLLDDALAIVDEAKKSVGVKTAEAALIEQDLRPLAAFRSSIADIPVSRSAAGEIAKSLRVGTYAGIPEAFGKAAQYLAPGTGIADFGRSLEEDAAAIRTLPEMQPSSDIEQRPILKTVSGVVESLPQTIVPIAAGAAATFLGAPAVVAGAVGAGTAFGYFGGSSATDTKRVTKDAYLKQGLAESDAEQRSSEDAFKTFLVQGIGDAALTAIGMKTVGAFGKMAGVTRGSKNAIEALNKIASPAHLKSFGKDALLAIGSNAIEEPFQDVTQAAIEANAGVKQNRTFGEIAKESAIGGGLMGAFFTLIGLPVRGLQARAYNRMVTSLADPSIDPEARAETAYVIADQIAKTDKGAADQWLMNAAQDIIAQKPISLQEDSLAARFSKIRQTEGAKGFVMQGEGQQESFESTLDRIKQATETGGKAAIFNPMVLRQPQNVSTIAPEGATAVQRPEDIPFSRVSDLATEGAPLEGEVLPVDRGALAGHVPDELKGELFPSALLPQGAQVPAVRPTGLPAVGIPTTPNAPAGPAPVVQNGLAAPVRPGLPVGGIGDVPAIRQTPGVPAGISTSELSQTPIPAPVPEATIPSPKPEPPAKAPVPSARVEEVKPPQAPKVINPKGEQKPATKPEPVNVFKTSKADLVKELADAGITENKLTGKMTKNMGKADLAQMVKKLREGKNVEENKPGVSGEVQQGEKPVKAEPVKKVGGKKAGRSGNVQAPEAGAVDRGRAAQKEVKKKTEIKSDIGVRQQDTPEAVVKDAVAAAPATTPAELKKQKKFLIEHIDEAIGEAPDITEKVNKAISKMADLKKKAENLRSQDFKSTEERNAARAALDSERRSVQKGIPSVTIEVPNDGTFTVYNNRATLQAFKEIVSKKFPTTLAKEEGVPRMPSTKPKGYRAPAKLEDGITIKIDGKPAYTDGSILLMGTFKGIPSTPAESWMLDKKPALRESLATSAKNLLENSKKNATHEVTDVKFVAVEEANKEVEKASFGVADQPIEGEQSHTVLTAGEITSVITTDYFQHIIDQHPNATFKLGVEMSKGDNIAPVGIYDKGKQIGIVMPIRSNAVEMASAPLFSLEDRGILGSKEADNEDVNARPVVNTESARKLQARIEAQTGRKISVLEVSPPDEVDADTIAQLAKIFGKTVVYVKTPGTTLFHGVTTDANTIYINVATAHPHLSIFGHELIHAFRLDNPTLYNNLRTYLQEQINEEEFYDYQQRLNMIETQQGLDRSEDAATFEEVLGDFLGNRILDKSFINQLAAKEPTIFQRLASLIKNLIARISQSFAKQNLKVWKDLTAVQNAVTDALATYAGTKAPASIREAVVDKMGEFGRPELKFSLAKGGDTNQNTASFQTMNAIDEHVVKQANANPKLRKSVSGGVEKLFDILGSNVPPKMKAEFAKIFSTPWFGSEGNVHRRAALLKNVERSHNRNTIRADIYSRDLESAYLGIEGMKNALDSMPAADRKTVDLLIKEGDIREEEYTVDQLRSSENPTGAPVSKEVVTAYRAFRQVIEKAGEIRFQRLREIAVLPYKNRDWYNDLTSLLGQKDAVIAAAARVESIVAEIASAQSALDAANADVVAKNKAEEESKAKHEQAKTDATWGKVTDIKAEALTKRDLQEATASRKEAERTAAKAEESLAKLKTEQTEAVTVAKPITEKLSANDNRGEIISALASINTYRTELERIKKEWGKVKGYAPKTRKDGEYFTSVYQVFSDWKFVETEDGTKAMIDFDLDADQVRQVRDIAKKQGTKVVLDKSGVLILSRKEGVKETLDAIRTEMPIDEQEPLYRKVYMQTANTEAGAERHKAEVDGNRERYLKSNFDKTATYTTEVERNTKTPVELMRFKGTDLAMESMIDNAFETAAEQGVLDEAEIDALKSKVLESLARETMAQGFGRHGISRAAHLIEGYKDKNYIEVATDFASGMSGWLSKMEFAIEASNVMREIPNDKPEDKTWVHQYVEDARKNATVMDQMSGTARSVASLYLMAFKASTVILNGFQNFTIGQAELSKHTSNPLMKLIAAQKDVLKDYTAQKSGGKRTLSKEEVEVLDKASREGIDQAQVVEFMSGLSEGGGNKYLNKATRLGMTPFQWVETHLNREPAMLAAYRVFKKTEAGVFDQEAFTKAEEFVYNTHYLMGKENLPQLARNPLGKTLYVFQGYVHNYMHWMFNRFKQGEWEVLARSLGAIVALGGAAALPIVGDLDKWIEKWFGVSYQLKFKKFMRENTKGMGWTGDVLNDFVNHGLPSVAGVDMSKAIAVNLPIVSDPEKSVAERIGGAWGTLLTKPALAMKALGAGNTSRAIENLMPEFIANPMRAIRQTGGATTVAGKPILDEQGKQVKYSGADVAKKVLGFQPIRQTERTDIQRSERALKETWEERRNETLAKLRNAKTREEVIAARRGIMKFNIDLRGSQIFGPVGIITSETITRSLAQKRDKKQEEWMKNQLATES